VYDEAYMQVGAYAEFFEEMGLGEIMGALIIHTNAKTRSGIVGLGTHLKTRDELHDAFMTFRHAQYIWNKKNASAAPKLFVFPSVIAQDMPIIEEVEPEEKKTKKRLGRFFNNWWE